MGLVDIPGWVLIGLGSLPIIASASVEKHYTQYYTGLWNLYGLIIIALGLLQDAETMRQILISVGLGTLISFIFIYILKAERKELIPKIGSSGNILAAISFSVGLFYFPQYVLYVGIFSFLILIFYWSRRLYFSRNTKNRYNYERRRS